MDIFTTQLTRVVQTPIKSTSLKVKALHKEADIGKLKEDPDHLENHEYYYIQEESGANNESSTDHQQSSHNANKESSIENVLDEHGNKIPHLDIFV